jgi:hypothetical protein
MAAFKEKHVCSKFYFKLGITTTDTLNLFKLPFVEQTMSRTPAFHWLSKFTTRVTPVKNAEHLEHLSTSKTHRNVA